MVNAEFSRIYRFVKLLVNEGFLAVRVAEFALLFVENHFVFTIFFCIFFFKL